MKAVTSNIRDNPDLPRPKVRAAAAATARLGGIALFQEIGEREDHIDIKKAMGPGWTWRNDHLAIPIAVKTRYWQVLEEGFQLMHMGLAGASPNRYISWVVVKRRNRLARMLKKAKSLAIINTHFVSGAWNAKAKSNKQWRQQRWGEHYMLMRTKILEFIERGISVLFGGDFNRDHVRPFLTDQRWVAQHGIDKIGFIEAPGGLRLTRVVGTGHTDTTSDHDALWADVTLAA